MKHTALSFRLGESEFIGAPKRVAISCDNPLTSRHIKAPWPNQSFSAVCIGTPGQGKSSLIYSLLEKAKRKEDNIYHRVFSAITWVCPPASRSSVQGLIQDLPEEMIFNEFDSAVLQQIEDNKEQFTKDGNTKACQLLILDDVTADLKTYQMELKRLIFNRRHLNLSIIILVQYATDVPKRVRMNISHVISFKPNAQGLRTLSAEYAEMDFNSFRRLAQFIFSEKHDYLFIDVARNKLYKNTQEILER